MYENLKRIIFTVALFSVGISVINAMEKGSPALKEVEQVESSASSLNSELEKSSAVTWFDSGKNLAHNIIARITNYVPSYVKEHPKFALGALAVIATTAVTAKLYKKSVLMRKHAIEKCVLEDSVVLEDCEALEDCEVLVKADFSSKLFFKPDNKGLFQGDAVAGNGDINLLSSIMLSSNFSEEILKEILEKVSSILEADYCQAIKIGYVDLSKGLLREIKELRKHFIESDKKMPSRDQWDDKELEQDLTTDNKELFKERACIIIRRYFNALKKYEAKKIVAVESKK